MSNTLRKYISIFIIGVLLIIFYKTFDLAIIGTIFKALQPVIIGGVIAYFLSPIVWQLEKRISKGKYQHLAAVLGVFIIFLITIIILLFYLIPILYDSTVAMVINLSDYIVNFEDNIKSLIPIPEISEWIINTVNSFGNSLGSSGSFQPTSILSYLASAGATASSILLGIIFAPYILLEANRLINIFDRSLSLLIDEEHIKVIHHYLGSSNKIIGDFFYGKFIDSIIIGIIAFIGLSLLRIPFYPVLAMIVLVTNMIPYFGPFIGGIPVLFVAFVTGGIFPLIYSAIFILALQQFDGLLLGPKILGDSVGISPFWIILSITFFGNLWGFIGMLLGVPIIGIVRVLYHDIVDYRNRKEKEKAEIES